MTWLEAIGWLGTVTYVVAYGLVATRTIPAGRTYFGLNLAAAVGVAVVSWDKGTWQAVALNVAWAGVSAYGLRGSSPPVRRLPVRGARAAVAVVLAAGLVALPAAGWPRAAALWGWASVLAYLLGYALFVARRIRQREFHAWNLVAALALVPQLRLDANTPVLALQGAWALLALVGLARGGGTSATAPADGEGGSGR